MPAPGRLAAPLAALALLAAAPARAQDPFEIQVYDAETVPPGDVGLELHTNFVVDGTGAASPEGELPTRHVTHLTFEPHVGVTDWAEAGFYLQTAIRPDGTYDYAGVKFRFKMRWPRRFARGLLGLALNIEVSEIPRAYEAARYGSELRPVIDLRWRRLYASINPIIGFAFTGPDAGHPDLEPCAKLAVDVAWDLSAGLEYFSGLGPVDAILPASEQTHRLFVALDFDRAFGDLGLAINLGAGYGFTGDDGWIVKLIVGLDFGRPHAAPRQP